MTDEPWCNCRYVPLFGAAGYDAALEREDDVPFEEQLRGFEDVIKAGKVGAKQGTHLPAGTSSGARCCVSSEEICLHSECDCAHPMKPIMAARSQIIGHSFKTTFRYRFKFLPGYWLKFFPGYFLA